MLVTGIVMLQGKETTAIQEAIAWQQNAGAWAEGLLDRFPLYADLLQPVVLAVFEIRMGLALLVAAVQQHVHCAEAAVHSDTARSLLTIPVPGTGEQTLFAMHLPWYYKSDCACTTWRSCRRATDHGTPGVVARRASCKLSDWCMLH